MIADINGPYFGSVEEDIEFTASATSGRSPYSYSWDLDNDGSFDDASGQNIFYSWNNLGEYTIKLKVRDQNLDESIDETEVIILNNPPAKPDTPSGPTNGKTNEEYEYSSRTTDIEGVEIYYLFDWSDGTDSGWLGPYESAETCSAKHIWGKAGGYIVKVKAKDTRDHESEWSEPLNVVMPKSKLFIFENFLKLLYKILPNIINI